MSPSETPPSRCPECRKPTRPGARHCRACGVALTASARVEARPRAGWRGSAPESEGSLRCSRCRQAARPGGRFCPACGGILEWAPTPHRASTAGNDSWAMAVSEAPRAQLAPAIGPRAAVIVAGVIALVGCFVPLASTPVGSLRLVPDITGRLAVTGLIPLACVAIAVIGAVLPLLGTRGRALAAGVVVALASPGLLAALAFTRATTLLNDWLDMLGGGSVVSIGGCLLLLGFALALPAGLWSLFAYTPAPGKEGSR